MSDTLVGRGLYPFAGLSTDASSPTSDPTASTWASKPIPGQRAFETDTLFVYEFDSLTWVKIRGTDSSGNPAAKTVDATSSDKVIIDDNVDGNQYIGYAPQGSATSAAVWAITKNDNGSPQIFTHSQPNQIWDNRTSGTYT